jgi:hypothetical protein
VVVEHHVGASQAFQAAHRDETWVAWAGADEEDRGLLHDLANARATGGPGVRFVHAGVEEARAIQYCHLARWSPLDVLAGPRRRLASSVLVV